MKLRNWKDRLRNFKISYEAMESECGELQEFLSLLCGINRNMDNAIPDMKKARFLELLRTQKNDFLRLYQHQQEMFKRVAAGWLDDLTDEDIDELFSNYLEADVFADSSEKYFKAVEQRIEEFRGEQTKTRLERLWREKTGTRNPWEWSSQYGTPILCMFDDNQRPVAAEMFSAFRRNKLSPAEADNVMDWLNHGDFYDRLQSQEERDACLKQRVVEDYSYLLTDMDKVRRELRNGSSMVAPYDWMDNHAIRSKIKQLADKHYKTGGASKAQAAIDDLGPDDLRYYLKNLIKTDMQVGIAILKRQGH